MFKGKCTLAKICRFADVAKSELSPGMCVQHRQ